MVKNGMQKWGNIYFLILHHRAITVLIFSKLFAATEPVVDTILAGQEIKIPPEPESCQFWNERKSLRFIFFEILGQFPPNFLKMLNGILCIRLARIFLIRHYSDRRQAIFD